jgi:hypothetical protein
MIFVLSAAAHLILSHRLALGARFVLRAARRLLTTAQSIRKKSM